MSQQLVTSLNASIHVEDRSLDNSTYIIQLQGISQHLLESAGTLPKTIYTQTKTHINLKKMQRNRH